MAIATHNWQLPLTTGEWHVLWSQLPAEAQRDLDAASFKVEWMRGQISRICGSYVGNVRKRPLEDVHRSDGKTRYEFFLSDCWDSPS